MKRKRRTFTPEQKVALLRLHLLEKKPVSEICEEHKSSVNLFYQWQAAFFENGAAAFEKTGKARQPARDAKDKKIAALEEKLAKKYEVLSEVMEEHVKLKKELGEIWRSDTQDAIVDDLRRWSSKTEIPVSRFLR